MSSDYDQESEAKSHPDLWTVRRVLAWSCEYLTNRDPELKLTARLDVEILLAATLGFDRVNLFLQLDRPLTKEERNSFKIFLKRRYEFEPVAYILGYRDFYRHRFQVNRHVLIPRPETELLVELASRAVQALSSPKILDVGTGSGCIAVSIGSELPSASVVGWDVNDDALDLARKNAVDNEVHNINFVSQDALCIDAIEDSSFDLIVSNPPYIAASETGLMGRSVLDYEPRTALFATDPEGLGFYRHYASNYHRILRPGGKIFLEVGFSQSAKVAHLFAAAGWEKIKVAKDLSGHDRVISAERSSTSLSSGE